MIPQGQVGRTFARLSRSLLIVPSRCSLILSSMQSVPSVVSPAGVTVRVPDPARAPAPVTPLLVVDARKSCTRTGKALYERWTTPWLDKKSSRIMQEQIVLSKYLLARIWYVNFPSNSVRFMINCKRKNCSSSPNTIATTLTKSVIVHVTPMHGKRCDERQTIRGKKGRHSWRRARLEAPMLFVGIEKSRCTTHTVR